MRRLMIPLCAILLTGTAHAAQPVQSFADPAIAKNVWVLKDESTNLIAMELTFQGGISLDPAGREGTVSMLGNVLTQGAGSRNAGEMEQILRDKAIGLSISSSRDQTIVTLSAPARNWPFAVTILKDVLFSPRLENGETERAIAAQIASVRSDLSDPNWQAQRIMNGKVFEGSPYARPGSGNPASLSHLTPGDFRAAAKHIFGAKPVHAVFVGHASKADTALSLEIFKDLPEPETRTATDYRQLARKRYFHFYNVPQSSLYYVVAGLPSEDPDYAALNVLNALLSDGFGSRLMKALREQSGLSYGISGGMTDADHGALWMFNVQVPDAQLAKAADIMRAELHKTLEADYTAQEVKEAAHSLAAQLPMGWTSSPAIASQLGSAQRDGYGPDYLNAWRKALENVTPEQVKAVAKRLLGDTTGVMIAVGRARPDQSWVETGLPGMEGTR